MASEDVIELGSSDDEVEPPPKKKKAIPNAMVHIPTKIHGVTIKPTSSKGPLKNDALTVTKVSKFVNPLANKNKSNGQPVQRVLNQNTVFVQNSNVIANKAPVTQGVNPINLFKKLNSQVVINKVPSGSNVMKNPVRVMSPKTISNLPPSITVKRAPSVVPVIPTKPIRAIRPMKQVRQAVQIKHTHPVQIVNKKKQKPRARAKVSNEVLTVDLDDDDTGSSTSSPQWYLRPEDEEKPTLEEENNKEPEKSKCDEITIEDSPVKPKAIKIVEEMSVTIEDSPVKPVPEKKASAESDEDQSAPKNTPQSKKKLDYPAEVEKQVIEIQFEPMEVDESEAMSKSKEVIETQTKETVTIETEDKTKEKENTDIQSKSKNVEIIPSEPKPKENEVITMSDDIVEIEESPMKEADSQLTSTPKKNQNRPPVKFPEEKTDNDSAEYSEFHPVYRNFIKLCFQLENSEDMKKIVEKKVKTYYRQVPKDYTESEQFIDMVSSKILAMKAGPDKMYLYIKDIVDELNLQRKMAKTQPPKPDKEIADKAESDNFLYGEHSEFDSKRQRQIRKLEKTLKKLHRAIQKLEEQEVDFDDEEDSVYLLTERYKERMMRVHAKFCQLTNTKMPSEPRVLLDPRPGHPPGPAKRLEKWINKKVPIGTPLPFPDFHDVLRCVKEANEEDKLGWNDVDIMEEARDLFTRCGKKLQRRRQENEWRTAVSRISLDTDPAEENDELRRKLEQNKQVAAKKEVEVFNKFADKQNQLKLEAEEIGDKEAEESPVESEEDEDETVDEESLENKHKRKERLRRLLQEKSKKNSDEKENESVEIISNTQRKDDTKAPSPTKDVEMKSTEEEEKQNNKDGKNEENPSADVKVKKEEDKKSAAEGDTIQIDSDIDELHLLQKLYSENEVNSSTVDSSDSDAPISISDTLDSDNADKKSVISIENSSYSESEMNKIETFEIDLEEEIPKPNVGEIVSIPNTEVVKGALDSNIEIECSENGVHKKQVQTNNDEYNESIEDILLASSDDEAGKDGYNPKGKSECVDNAISLDVSENIQNLGCIKNPNNVDTNRRFSGPENENPGSVENPGSIENPGSVEKPRSFNVSENIENPGSIENPVSIENPESIENSGSVDNPRSIENPGSDEDVVNLKDDNLSIGETVVGDENSQNIENTVDSPLNKNVGAEYGNSNDEISDNACINNENMDISEDVNAAVEDVISLDADCVMQTDDALSGDHTDTRVIRDETSNDDEVVHECVSLDDDSSACETVIENVGNESDSQGHEVGKMKNVPQGKDVEIGSDFHNQYLENIEFHDQNQDAEYIESDCQMQNADNTETGYQNDDAEYDYQRQDSENVESDLQNQEAEYGDYDYQNQDIQNIDSDHQNQDAEYDESDYQNHETQCDESEYQNQDVESIEFDGDQDQYRENTELDGHRKDGGNIKSDYQNQDAENIESDSQNEDVENIVNDSQSQDGVDQSLEEEKPNISEKVSTVNVESCCNYDEQNVNANASENIETIDNSMIVDDNDLESDNLNNAVPSDEGAKDEVNDHLRESNLPESIPLQTTT